MADFSGMATVYDIICSDGRVIRPGAFDHQDGQTVPIVWRHNNSKITNVIGHGVLSVSQSPPGIRITGSFNSTTEGRQAKQLVDSKDVTNLSIWANEVIENALYDSGMRGFKIKHDGATREVQKGTIREVSLVLSGANPGAVIDDFLRHSDDPMNMDEVLVDGILIHTDHPIVIEQEESEEPSVEPEFEEVVDVEEEEEEDSELSHADDSETVADILATLNEDQQKLFDMVLGNIVMGDTEAPSGDTQDGPSMQEVLGTLNDKQLTTLYFLAGSISEEDEPVQQSDEQGDQGDIIMRNIFEDDVREDNVLSHEDVQNVLVVAADRRTGTLREWFEKADITIAHSITNIDNLFPDAQSVSPGGPEFYSRPMEWVEKVLGAARPRPFSRIKSWYADLTPDAARAKGYVTGAEKAEEVVAVLKRTTTPQTVYKKQKLERDDILDITEFDIVVWLKSEMRLMLREELARAILIGDGRSGADPDKIDETYIRSILNDSSVYTITHWYNDIGNEQALSAFTDAEMIALIDDISLSMVDYMGTGTPTFYCQPEVRRRFMNLRDLQGRRLHSTGEALAAALGVKEVMEIPVMAGLGQEDVVNPTGLPAGTYDFQNLGIIVNLNDYVIGMDRGGQTNFFDDFDIDYNAMKYLYETRLSGALIHPKSAIAINLVTAKTA